MRAGTELRFVVRLKNLPKRLLKQLVRPRRDAQRPAFPILLGNVDTSDWCPSKALMAEIVDEFLNFLQFHPVYGLSVAASGHGSVVGIQTGIGPQVQRRIVQQSIDVLQRQSAFASFMDDIQDCFSIPHLACFPF